MMARSPSMSQLEIVSSALTTTKMKKLKNLPVPPLIHPEILPSSVTSTNFMFLILIQKGPSGMKSVANRSTTTMPSLLWLGNTMVLGLALDH